MAFCDRFKIIYGRIIVEQKTNKDSKLTNKRFVYGLINKSKFLLQKKLDNFINCLFLLQQLGLFLEATPMLISDYCKVKCLQHLVLN